MTGISAQIVIDTLTFAFGRDELYTAPLNCKAMTDRARTLKCEREKGWKLYGSRRRVDAGFAGQGHAAGPEALMAVTLPDPGSAARCRRS